ncbi:IS110 family transposase [Defluviitalea phaphyphila]|uniref:IS110 family transposase n=1 Tax=Defluviitalea phaphyphila TaxID=1473580 RepID=UPI000731BE36|nr:IS110 family transposase [Defluviitalea phaphyphila]
MKISIENISLVEMNRLEVMFGDINRFRNANKLARYAGVAPTRFSSAGKGKDTKGTQGNRTLNGVLYSLAMQQIQLTKGTKRPRNPILFEYYQNKISEGKTKTQVLIYIQRRLVNIIYGMMKNKTESVSSETVLNTFKNPKVIVEQ